MKKDLADQPKVVNWMIRHRSNLVYAVLILTVGLIGFGRVMSRKASRTENDFVQAEYDLMRISADRSDAHEALLSLQGILDRHKELRPKYDARLAQSLIGQGKVELGSEYASYALERASSGAEPYAQFGQTSLLIANSDLDQALDNAVSLQSKIDQETRPLLYLHNALRIALIHQELGNGPREKAAWDQFLVELEKSPARDRLLDSFHDGNTSLVDYAHARLSTL